MAVRAKMSGSKAPRISRARSYRPPNRNPIPDLNVKAATRVVRLDPRVPS